MVIRHIVCLRFREGCGAADVAAVVAGFRALSEEPAIRCRSFEGGANCSTEGLSAPFGAPSAGASATHIFTLTFDSDEDVSQYLIHPAHVAFVARLRPLLAPEGGVFVADYAPAF